MNSSLICCRTRTLSGDPLPCNKPFERTSKYWTPSYLEFVFYVCISVCLLGFLTTYHIVRCSDSEAWNIWDFFLHILPWPKLFCFSMGYSKFQDVKKISCRILSSRSTSESERISGWSGRGQKCTGSCLACCFQSKEFGTGYNFLKSFLCRQLFPSF